MLRGLWIGLISLTVCASPLAAAADGVRFGRGVVLETQLEGGRLTVRVAPDAWRTVDDLLTMDWSGTAGFDFVQISIDPALFERLAHGHLSYGGDEMSEVEQLVRALTEPGRFAPAGHAGEAGLGVVLQLPVSGTEAPSASYEREAIMSAAAILQRAPRPRAALALSYGSAHCEEGPSTARDWQQSLASYRQMVRRTAPDLPLVLYGLCNDIPGLVGLDPDLFDDENLIFGFEFFEPKGFTSQGAGPARDVKGLPWPAADVAIDLAMIYSKRLIAEDSVSLSDWTKRLFRVRHHHAVYMAEAWTKARIARRFAEIDAWASRHGIAKDRLLLGAFGVNAARGGRAGALAADRFRWLDAVRRETDALGVPWTFRSHAEVDSVAIAALDLSHEAPPSAPKTNTPHGRSGPAILRTHEVPR